MRLIRFMGWAVCLSIASPAWAQFIGNQTNVQADGFHLGPLVIHPFANADLRYDTNPALQPSGLASGDLSLRGRGGFRLELDSSLFDLSFSGQGDYTRYFGITDARLVNLSSFQAGANLQLGINGDGWLSATITEQFSRLQSGSQIVVGQNVRFIRNTARASAKAKPGGGALEFNAGYGFDFVFFDQDQTSIPEPRALSVYSHIINANAQWRFFPRTAVSVEAEQMFTRYFYRSTTLPNVEANPFRVRAGVNGQVTEHISVRAMAGYGNAFISGATGNFNSVVASVGVTWEPFETLTLALKYERDVMPVSLFGYFSMDKVTAAYKQTFIERIVATAQVDYQFEKYGRSIIAGLPDRADNVIRGEVRGSYLILKFLAVGLYYMPEFRLTPYRAPGTNISGQYLRNIFGFDVTVGY